MLKRTNSTTFHICLTFYQKTENKKVQADFRHLFHLLQGYNRSMWSFKRGKWKPPVFQINEEHM